MVIKFIFDLLVLLFVFLYFVPFPRLQFLHTFIKFRYFGFWQVSTSPDAYILFTFL